MSRLIIRHISAGTTSPSFVVIHAPDHRTADPAEVVSPVGFPVEGRFQSDLTSELRWYLEEFLDYPFSPWTERAQRVQNSLRQWGRQAFKALFHTGRGHEFYINATRDGLKELHLEVRSDDPRVLAWPWEALEDEEAARLALTCQLERRVNKIAIPPPLSSALPTDWVKILLVTARPYERDFSYRSVSRPLVELLGEQKLPAEVTVLRPPTFARLQEVLETHPNTFHILHFDGPGGYGDDPSIDAESGADKLQGSQGRLVFETDDYKPDLVDSDTLANLLHEHRIPAVVLNACQSGMVDHEADDAFASVAAGLLKGGVRSVVAMAYSLYVGGAQYFLSSFYQSLFKTGDVGEATRSGRRKMYEKSGRSCARGEYRLADWLVPVVYQQESLDLSFATKG